MDRENFKNKAKQSIDEIFAKIDELEAKKAELTAKYNKLMDSSDENWEEVKNAFSSASESFKEGFSKIGSLFK